MYKKIGRKVILARNDQKLIVAELDDVDIFSVQEGHEATKELVAKYGVLTVSSKKGESVKISHPSPNWYDVMLIVYPFLSKKVWRARAFELFTQEINK